MWACSCGLDLILMYSYTAFPGGGNVKLVASK